MAGDFVELLDAFDRAVVASYGVVSEEASARALGRAAELRRRRGFQGQTLVLGIAGGTGTGKSSLLNAIAREPVASVSRLRPHTEQPLAWVPERRGPGLDGLLDDLRVHDRIPQARWPGLGLIDLPDMDSVADQHRRTVEKLIPKVDGLIWVFDPSKYGDPALHDGFLQPLADYRDQFLFVLNKVDTLDAAARVTLSTEVRRRLRDDGYPEARIFLTAAAPPSGEAEGIQELEAHLREEVDTKRTAVSKWLIDVARELRRLGDEAGVWDGASVGFGERWARDREAAISGILPGRGPGGRADAVCRLEDLVAMVAVEAGSRAGGSITSRFPEGAVEEVLREAEHQAGRAAEGMRLSRRAAEAAAGAAREVLDRRIGRTLRDELQNRARFGAVLLEAGLRVTQLRLGGTSGGTEPRAPVKAGARGVRPEPA